MTEYEKIEKRNAFKRLLYLKEATDRYNDQLIAHGPITAVCDPILDEITFKDFVAIANFAGVKYDIKIKKITPLEALVRGAYAEDV